MNEIIKQELLSILNQLGWASDTNVIVSPTKNPEHGDYSSNIALILSKSVDQPPMKIARKIQSMVNHAEITRVDVASPGFLNFFTTRDYTPQIQMIIDNDERFFAPSIGKGRVVYLEYVSANPTGPLHVGHGRSAAYGSSLASILSKTGFNIHTEYYINDAGLQIDILTASMWLCLLNLPVPDGCYKGKYLSDMSQSTPEMTLETPPALTEILSKWSIDTGSSSHDSLIKLCKETLGSNYSVLKKWIVQSITEQIKSDLNAFSVKFDHWFSESTVLENNSLQSLLQQLEKSGHTYEKDSALWFKSTDYEDEKDRVLRRSNGIYTYFAHDLAYHYHKCHSKPHTIINIFGADHHGYIPRVKAGLHALGLGDNQFKCILIQFANLFRGSEKVQMSTRSGEFVTLKDLYDEVGIDAARFFYCMKKCDQHLDFDLELAKSRSSQNPVYYIQYAHARIFSIFEKNGQYLPASSHWQQASDIELKIMEKIADYPRTLIRVSQHHEVYQLPKYLLELATLFHKYYNNTPILTDNPNDKHHRLLLCYMIAKTIRSGLSLLHISSPESM